MTLLFADPPLAEVDSRVTADELLAKPDGFRFELVNGELVERQRGWESECLGMNLAGLLWSFCQQTNPTRRGTERPLLDRPGPRG